LYVLGECPLPWRDKNKNVVFKKIPDAFEIAI
jgi:hypothetical protein